jgi:hypothetical protein
LQPYETSMLFQGGFSAQAPVSSRLAYVGL